MSKKLSNVFIKKSPKKSYKNSKNNLLETTKKLEPNNLIEEEFWRDCLALNENKISKKISQNSIAEDKIKINSHIDIKEIIKNDIIENICKKREIDLFQEKLKIPRLISCDSAKNFKINQERISKLNDHGKYSIESNSKSNWDPKNLIAKNKNTRDNDLSKDDIQSDVTNLPINSLINKNLSHNNLYNQNKSKKLNKSMSMELLGNNKLKISPSVMNLIKDQEKNDNKKRTFERTEILHKTRLKKTEELKEIKKHLDECRIMYEMEDCTFKPNINSNNFKREKSQNNVNSENISFYERLNIWKKKKIEKSDHEKKLLNKREFNKCSFSPNISNSIPVYKDVNKFDEFTIKYFERVNKARGEKLLLKKQLELNIRTISFILDENDKIINVKDPQNKAANNEKKKDPSLTFNAVVKSDIDIGNLKQTLRNQLKSINLNNFENYGISEEEGL